MAAAGSGCECSLANSNIARRPCPSERGLAAGAPRPGRSPGSCSEPEPCKGDQNEHEAEEGKERVQEDEDSDRGLAPAPEHREDRPARGGHGQKERPVVEHGIDGAGEDGKDEKTETKKRHGPVRPGERPGIALPAEKTHHHPPPEAHGQKDQKSGNEGRQREGHGGVKDGGGPS
jgi:hypothetical protein